MAGLYVHIPFCVQKCAYCDFVSFTDHSRMAGYTDALLAEARLCAPRVKGRAFDTVFIGGGTPSILPDGHVKRLMEGLGRIFDIAPGAEVSMESNPGTLCAQKLGEYREAGVNRLSIGLQSADDGLLRRIGRIHDLNSFLASYALAREAGFDNINIDIMHGLPGQSLAAHERTLETVSALSPEHISAYSLILEEGTPLFAAVAEKRESLPDEDAAYELYALTKRYLEEKGYMRYEISNYSRPGRECAHNMNYWNNGEYLGLGVNAHSAFYADGVWTRAYNTADIAGYMARLSAGESPTAESAPIARGEEMFECVMLGLRMSAGFSLTGFEKRFGKAFENVYPKAIAGLEDMGWLRLENGRAHLTQRGLDMQNEALLAFME